jgi:hypothetical protein
MIGTATISIFLLFVASWFAWGRWNKARRITASDKYHSAILSVLKGIYPDTSNWKEGISDTLKQSIPSVELATTEFKRFITRKADIETALHNYKECCYETTYEKCTAYILHGKKIGNTDPRDIFKNRVGALLEFAKSP